MQIIRIRIGYKPESSGLNHPHHDQSSGSSAAIVTLSGSLEQGAPSIRSFIFTSHTSTLFNFIIDHSGLEVDHAVLSSTARGRHSPLRRGQGGGAAQPGSPQLLSVNQGQSIIHGCDA